MTDSGNDAPAVPIAREVVNTLQTRVVPVIVVPGVMGSRLRMSAAGVPIYWDPDNVPTLLLLAGMPLLIKVAVFYSEGSLITDPRVQGFPEVAWHFYGPLLTELQASLPATSPVYALGYDWRQANDDSGKVLASRVADILAATPGATQVILVTHSMGGLVARAALKMVPGFEAKVLGVIHAVQPVLGAAKSYANFVRGPNESADVPGYILERILGPAAWQYLAVMSATPGPVQLLPNQEYHLPPSGAVAQPPEGLPYPVSTTEWLQAFGDDGAWGFSNDVYDTYASYGIPGVVQHWQPKMLPHYIAPVWNGMMERMQDLLHDASVIHAALKGYAHPLTKVVVSRVSPSTPLGTISFTHERLIGNSTSYGQFVGAGDGTVPFESQNAVPGTPGWPEAAAQCDGGHAEIFQQESARAYVKQCILAMLAK